MQFLNNIHKYTRKKTCSFYSTLSHERKCTKHSGSRSHFNKTKAFVFVIVHLLVYLLSIWPRQLWHPLPPHFSAHNIRSPSYNRLSCARSTIPRLLRTLVLSSYIPFPPIVHYSSGHPPHTSYIHRYSAPFISIARRPCHERTYHSNWRRRQLKPPTRSWDDAFRREVRMTRSAEKLGWRVLTRS